MREAVQDEDWPARTGVSHEMVVVVALRFTVMLVVSELVA